MTKEIAIEIIRIYEEEKKEVEKDKTSKVLVKSGIYRRILQQL